MSFHVLLINRKKFINVLQSIVCNSEAALMCYKDHLDIVIFGLERVKLLIPISTVESNVIVHAPIIQ